MTRTDPPNPHDGHARPPLTTAERDQLDSHLREANKGTALAREADPNSPAFPGLLDRVDRELSAARRIVHAADDTAALATHGTEAVRDDDVEVMLNVYWRRPAELSNGTPTTDEDRMRAAARALAARLAERMPAPAEQQPWRGTCGQIGHPGACQCDGTTDVTCGPCTHPAGGHYGIGGCTAIGPDGEPCCDCQRAGADIRMAGQ